MEEAHPPQERLDNVVAQLEALEAIALRTTELMQPTVEGSMNGCVLTWRNPSRRLILDLHKLAFSSSQWDLSVEVRAPGASRIITVENISYDSPVIPRPSDPTGSVMRLFSALRAEAGRHKDVDDEAELQHLMGRTLETRERLSLSDPNWMISCGSSLHGPGHIMSAGDGVSQEREIITETTPCMINPGKGAEGPLDAAPRLRGMRMTGPSPLLCTFVRRSAMIRHDEIDPQVKLRTLASYLGRRAA